MGTPEKRKTIPNGMVFRIDRFVSYWSSERTELEFWFAWASMD